MGARSLLCALPMILYKTRACPVVEFEGQYYEVQPQDWDWLINHESLAAWLKSETTARHHVGKPTELLAPIGTQEVWAAGVTYKRSKAARMEESSAAASCSLRCGVTSA